MYEFFKEKHDVLNEIDWDTWLYAPGMPIDKPNFDTSLADACFDLAQKWVDAIKSAPSTASNAYFEEKFSESDLETWNSQQEVVFIDSISDSPDLDWKDPKTHAAVQTIGELYSFSSSSNPEVISRWYHVAVQARVTESYKPLSEWLGTVGRMKFVRPGYRQLNKVHRQLAVEAFKKNESFYHPICRSMVVKDLGL